LYSPIDYPSVMPTVACDVMCRLGQQQQLLLRGRVLDIRSSNGSDDSNTTNTVVVVVRLSTWRLARRNTVTCSLNLEQVRTVRFKRIYEMSIPEKIDYANELKHMATQHYYNQNTNINTTTTQLQPQHDIAMSYYERAVHAVQYVQHETHSDNCIRADLLLVYITCCNNCAQCCTRLQQQQQKCNSNSNNKSKHYWDKARVHAQQALSLIEALELKKGGQIHTELRKLQYYDIRIFGEWKVKAMYILALVLLELDDNVQDAIRVIQKARAIIANYYNSKTNRNDNNIKSTSHYDDTTTTTTSKATSIETSKKQLHKSDRDLIALYNRCKVRQKEQLQQEKVYAQAMFSKSKITRATRSITASSSIPLPSIPTTRTKSSALATATISSSESPPTSRTSTPVTSNVTEKESDPSSRNTSSQDGNHSDTSYGPGHEEKKSSDRTTASQKQRNDVQATPRNLNPFKPIINDNHNPTTTATSTSSSNSKTTIAVDTIPWHNDAYVLGGLGVLIGMVGTLILFSQLTPKR
jgi:hypothetical protein